MRNEYYKVEIRPFHKSPYGSIDGWNVSADGYYGLEYKYKKEAKKKAREIAKNNRPAKVVNRNIDGKVIGETHYE